jgi:hypothetical protein
MRFTDSSGRQVEGTAPFTAAFQDSGAQFLPCAR